MKKLIFIFSLCLTAQLLFMSQAVAYGDLSSRLEGKIAALKRDNLKLEQEIASQASFATIVQKATEAGFIPVTFLSVKSASPVALRH